MTKATLLKIGGAVALGGVAAAAAVLLFIKPQPVAASWIDDPLDGAVIAPGSHEIVAHLTFPGQGVGLVTVSVDGTDLATLNGAGARLFTAKVAWDATLGTHHLEVDARTPSALDALPPATARVEVVDDALSAEAIPGIVPPTTTTTAPTTTTTAPTTTTAAPTTTTAAPTTTTTLCPLAKPVNQKPTGGNTVSTRLPVFSWTYPTCNPTWFQLQLTQTRDFSTIERTVKVAGTQRSWQPDAAHPLACATYTWRVRALETDAGPWSDATSFTVSPATIVSVCG